MKIFQMSAFCVAINEQMSSNKRIQKDERKKDHELIINKTLSEFERRVNYDKKEKV